MKKNICKISAGLFLAAICSVAFAGDPVTIPTVNPIDSAGILSDMGMSKVISAMKGINNQCVQPALSTAIAALTFQWIITFYKELFNGDLSSSLFKSVGLITWLGIAITLINNQSTYLPDLFDGYVKLICRVAGLTQSDFSLTGILSMATSIIKANHVAIINQTNNPLDIVVNLVLSLQLVGFDILTLITFFVVAIAVAMVQLEFWMMFAVAPLAFGLIPLAAFRDQGMAPIKGLMSLGMRVIILGAIISAAKFISANLLDLIQTPGTSYAMLGMEMNAVMLAMVMIAVLAFQSGKIASDIASGTASFSGSDAIRTGMSIAQTTGLGVAAVGVAASATTSAVKNTVGGAASMFEKAAERFSTFGHQATATAASSGGGGGLGSALSHTPPSPPPSSASQTSHASHAAPATSPGSQASSSSQASNNHHFANEAANSNSGGAQAGSAGSSSAEAAASARMANSSSNAQPSSSSAAGLGSQLNSNAANAQNTGDASSASIGAAPQTPLEKRVEDLAQALNQKPSPTERLGSSLRSASDQHANSDQGQVGVQINLHAD